MKCAANIRNFFGKFAVYCKFLMFLGEICVHCKFLSVELITLSVELITFL